MGSGITATTSRGAWKRTPARVAEDGNNPDHQCRSETGVRDNSRNPAQDLESENLRERPHKTEGTAGVPSLKRDDVTTFHIKAY